MARREYSFSPQCVHDGCSERAHYVFTTRRDQTQTMADVRKRGGWRCTRHSQPDAVLTVHNPDRETVLVSYETDFGYGGKTHRFFAPQGQEKGGSGFVHGPGFKVFAEDFPAGTRLIVTARIETAANRPEAYANDGTHNV